MRRFLCVVALACPAGAGAADDTAERTHGMATPEAEVARYPAPFQRFIRETERDMGKMTMAMHSAGFTGNTDVDFLAMMIPHHQGAVDMARLVLIHGKDPLTRQLAEDIVASQTAEIAAMRARLDILRRAPDAGPDEFPALHGTRGTRE
ncbi:MAG TPA: DUF305 domain-containing protein [Thiobacillus sp.]